MPDPEVIVTEGSGTSSDAPDLDPKTLLEAEKAKDELKALEVRQVADLIPRLQTMVEQEIQKVRLLAQALEKLLKQAMEIHSMMLADAEAQFEITKTFQSTLIVLDQIRGPGTLEAANQPPQSSKK
jgi:hypothetical protein